MSAYKKTKLGVSNTVANIYIYFLFNRMVIIGLK